MAPYIYDLSIEVTEGLFRRKVVEDIKIEGVAFSNPVNFQFKGVAFSNPVNFQFKGVAFSNPVNIGDYLSLRGIDMCVVDCKISNITHYASLDNDPNDQRRSMIYAIYYARYPTLTQSVVRELKALSKR
jgi:hypothetical protein